MNDPIFKDMPNPTKKDLDGTLFNAIYRAIKDWDINVPGCYDGYCGATGSHVKLVMNEIEKSQNGLQKLQRVTK